MRRISRWNTRPQPLGGDAVSPQCASLLWLGNICLQVWLSVLFVHRTSWTWRIGEILRAPGWSGWCSSYTLMICYYSPTKWCHSLTRSPKKPGGWLQCRSTYRSTCPLWLALWPSGRRWVILKICTCSTTFHLIGEYPFCHFDPMMSECLSSLIILISWLISWKTSHCGKVLPLAVFPVPGSKVGFLFTARHELFWTFSTTPWTQFWHTVMKCLESQSVKRRVSTRRSLGLPLFMITDLSSSPFGSTRA